MKTVGLVDKHEYCDECQDVYKEYEKKVDAIHTELAMRWDVATQLLREEMCIK